MSKTSSSTKKGASARVTKPSAHPSWIDMIKECIVAHPEDSRLGVSRPTIKKFVESKYKLTIDASHASLLSRAIISGSEKGTFILPKGLSGKVKLDPKAKADTVKEMNKAEKENTKVTKAVTATPKKAATAKKTLATSTNQNKRPASTKSSGGKGRAAKKPVEKAQSKTVSKTPIAKPAKKPAATASSSRKPAVVKPRPAAKKTTTKKIVAKKAAAKTSASKPKKPVSKAKPTVKAGAASKKPASTRSTKSASANAKNLSATKA